MNAAGPILGIKLLPNHTPEVRERVIADPAWRCIVLFRPNFLAVHASQLAATQTGVWAQSGRHDGRSKRRCCISSRSASFAARKLPAVL